MTPGTIDDPSGRIVTYYRDTTGRINQVTTKQNATAASVTLSNAIVYHPMSTLVKSQNFGNGLNDWNTYTTNEELDVLGLYNGAVSVINRSHTRTDNQNLTNIFDTVAPANNMSFWMENANRLQNANGPWGQKTFYYDGVGNRTTEITTAAGITTTDTLGYPATSNKIANMTRAAATLRTFVHDAGGNITSDTRSGTAYAYAYNKRNRLATVTVAASLKGTYTYNAKEQLSIRVTSNMTPSGTTHFIHDLNGNVIAETAGGGATGTTGTVREYIYLPETEIAPAADGRTRVDRPLAVVNAVNTATPATYYVHSLPRRRPGSITLGSSPRASLNRPVMMTDSTKAQVWAAVWQAWGGSYSITGPQANDARFPGQWFQLESGLHYNWHRHYDPSIGRYTQPDPLGFVDGPSVYGYVGGLPQSRVDIKGRQIEEPKGPSGDVSTSMCLTARVGVLFYCKGGAGPSRCEEADECQTLLKKIDIKLRCVMFQKILTACYGDSGDHGTRIDDEMGGIRRCEKFAERKNCFQCKPGQDGPKTLTPIPR